MINSKQYISTKLGKMTIYYHKFDKNIIFYLVLKNKIYSKISLIEFDNHYQVKKIENNFKNHGIISSFFFWGFKQKLKIFSSTELNDYEFEIWKNLYINYYGELYDYNENKYYSYYNHIPIGKKIEYETLTDIPLIFCINPYGKIKINMKFDYSMLIYSGITDD